MVFTKTIHILIGLPGSGKSYFANSNATDKSYRINTDKLLYEDNVTFIKMSKTPYNRLTDSLCSGYFISKNNILNKDLIIDGLFLNKETIVNVISAVNEAIIAVNARSKNRKEKFCVDIILHYWNEDRENCFFNDKYCRVGYERELSSENSIRNMEYINLNDKNELNDLIKSIKETQIENALEIRKVDLKTHKVYCMDDTTKKIKKLIYRLKNPYVDKNNILRSVSWCTGGAYGNYADSSLSPAIAEEPEEFVEFDEILEYIAPNLSFLQYKNIKNKCVKLDSYFESDYYGGGANYAYWTCDLNKLIEMCEEYGYDINFIESKKVEKI